MNILLVSVEVFLLLLPCESKTRTSYSCP